MCKIFSRQNLKKRHKRDFVHSQETWIKCNVLGHLLVLSLVTCGTFLNTSNLGSGTTEQDKNHCYLKLVASYLTFVQWGFSRFTDKKIPVPGNVLQVIELFI